MIPFYNNGYSELYHYGVKGQKWGVRRQLDRIGYGRLRAKADRYDRAIRKSKNSESKRSKYLLAKRDKIRAKMNKKYSDLNAKDRDRGVRAYQKISRAKKIVLGALAGAAGTVALDIAKNGGIRKGINVESDIKTTGYGAYSYREAGDTVSATATVRNALQIGRWVLGYGDSYTARGTATVVSATGYGHSASELANFQKG